MAFDVVKWMAENGRPGYRNKIAELEARKTGVAGDELAKVNAEIEEVRQAAQDRYDDWATDPEWM